MIIRLKSIGGGNNNLNLVIAKYPKGRFKCSFILGKVGKLIVPTDVNIVHQYIGYI